MTYFGFLLQFLIAPIFLLLAIIWWTSKSRKPTRGFQSGHAVWIAIAIHIVLALAYTTPWDNYLVATRVWYYNPKLVSGIVFGYVPIEEYTFFALETILAGLWWRFLEHKLPEPKNFKPSKLVRFATSFILFGVWMISAYIFFSHNLPLTYLSITLFWALPAILPQLIFGADILWQHRRLVALAILVPATYLSLMDIVALKATTWSISPAQTTGIFIGSLPLEEGVFFFITATLVCFGITLLLAKESQLRWIEIKKTFKRLSV
ncbi:MAG TPA: lycopene cyclase domain-containing protein [Anaerolineales bacterium]